ncbi:MAG: hypothetical protein IJF21_01905 [Clostridia bacterium]|nr:hypothetical protein [Clostridia bacterium]
MKKKIITLALLLSALILETLPYGAVCNFANPEGEPWRKTYSYFSMIPYGYGDFGPLITAILTCILLVIIILSILLKKDWSRSISIISAIATLTSLAPLMFGFSNFSLVGAMISACILATFVISRIKF